MRLFLAVELPDAVRQGLDALQARLRDSWPGWRWVRPEGIHLTLRFLGEVDEATDAAARAGWRQAAAGCAAFRFRLEGLGRFPPGGRPRVLWVGVGEEGSSGRLAALATAVEGAARKAGFAAERRTFHPHLTLARAKRGGRPQWGEGIEPGIEEAVAVDRLVLFRSELRPDGARYTALDSFPLGGGMDSR